MTYNKSMSNFKKKISGLFIFVLVTFSFFGESSQDKGIFYSEDPLIITYRYFYNAFWNYIEDASTLNYFEKEISWMGEEIDSFLNSPNYKSYSKKNSIYMELGLKLQKDFYDFKEAFSNKNEFQTIEAVKNIDHDMYSVVVFQKSFAVTTCNLYLSMMLFFILLMFMTLYLSLFYGKKYRYTIQELGTSKMNEENTSQMSKAYIIALEKQETEFSRELHDTVIQDLRAIKLHSEVLKVLPESEEDKKKIAEISSTCVSSLRNLCYDLTPPDLAMEFSTASGALVTAVSNLCEHFTRKTGIPCPLNSAPNLDVGNLKKEEFIYIYRIIQEALTNVEKHSKAESASVLLRNDNSNGNEKLLVFITDDGIGFNPKSYSPDYIKYHFGMRNMITRAELINGTINIISEDGDGTVIRLEVPLE